MFIKINLCSNKIIKRRTEEQKQKTCFSIILNAGNFLDVIKKLFGIIG